MKSILSKLWLGITSLVLTILLIIWLFQVILLKEFHIQERQNILLEEGEKITSLILESNTYPIISQDVFDELNSFKSTSSFNMMITILDSNNRVVFHNINHTLIRKHLSFLRGLDANLHSHKVETFVQKGKKYKRPLIITKIPIKQGKHITGNIILSSALMPIRETTSILKKQLSIITVISLIIATLLALLFAKHFTKPILQITETSKKISKGDFSASVHLDSKDEIGVLGKTINNLAIQLTQIEQFRREFIANVSHELKTPISLIRAYAELVMDVDEDTKDKNQHLQVIIDESTRLNTMVEDILYLSKMEAGYTNSNFTSFLIIELIHDVIEKLNFFAFQKNINIITKIDDESSTLYGDRDKIYQVFFNLINNAIHHSYENSQIIISVKNLDNTTRIEIIDHGKGIPKKDLPYIWDRFYKVDKSRKRDDSGTGLGMSIVKNILEIHNFQYGIESKIGKGTTVWMDIKKK